MPAQLLPKNQAAWRRGCSLRLYHIDTTTVSAGAIGASAIPRASLIDKRPAALKQVAVNISTDPQIALEDELANSNYMKHETYTDAVMVLPTFQRTNTSAAG